MPRPKTDRIIFHLQPYLTRDQINTVKRKTKNLRRYTYQGKRLTRNKVLEIVLVEYLDNEDFLMLIGAIRLDMDAILFGKK